MGFNLCNALPKDGIFLPKHVGVLPYYLRVSNTVHLVGKIKEYIDPKDMGGGGQLKKLPVVNVAFTCGLFIKLNKSSKLICSRQQHQAEYPVAMFI